MNDQDKEDLVLRLSSLMSAVTETDSDVLAVLEIYLKRTLRSVSWELEQRLMDFDKTSTRPKGE